MNQAFYAHYQALYGSRWEGLFEALSQKKVMVKRWNPFCGKPDPDASSGALAWNDAAFQISTEVQPKRMPSGLFDFYLMDPASLLPVMALNPVPGSRVLDMCAAPGGKGLVLAQMIGPDGFLEVNDVSKTRFFKMRGVFSDYLDSPHLQATTFSCKDGLWYGLHRTNEFDFVLLDAPCSSERHLMDHPAEWNKWSPARTRQLAKRQYGLLTSALRTLKPGGRLVYSTCSLSPEENDGVIERLLKKGRHQARIERPALPVGESTLYGNIVLPDVNAGSGPLYLATMVKDP